MKLEEQKLAFLLATTRITDAQTVLKSAEEELARGNYSRAAQFLDKVGVLAASAQKQAALLDNGSRLPLG